MGSQFCTVCYDIPKLSLTCSSCMTRICMKLEGDSTSGCLYYSEELRHHPSTLCHYCCAKTSGTKNEQTFKVGHPSVPFLHTNPPFAKYQFHHHFRGRSRKFMGIPTLNATLIISVEWHDTSLYSSPGILMHELFGGTYVGWHEMVS